MKFCRNCGTALATPVPGGIGAPMMGPPGGAPMMPPAGPMGTPMPPAPMSPAQAALAPTPLPPPPFGGPMSGSPLPGAGATARNMAQGSTITCPRCGTATPLGFAYCQQCGLHLQPVAPTDPGAPGGGRPRTPSAAPPGGVVGGSIGGLGGANQPVDPQGATLAAEGVRAGSVMPPQARASSAPMVASPSPAPIVITPPVAAPVRASSAGVQWGSAVLVNRDGSDGQRFALTSDDTIVGRAGADIVFDEDRFLARQHARIERAPDGNVRIHPLDTLNGVFKKTDGSVELADGATILVGREVLRFERVAQDERAVHPLVRHGVALFGSPPREPWGRLVQLIPSGGYRDVRHLFTEEIVLGREEGDIVFRDDAFMSRRHAALTWDGKRALLTDLGSSNGTFIRITGPTPVKHGDHVRMGDQLLRIER